MKRESNKINQLATNILRKASWADTERLLELFNSNSIERGGMLYSKKSAPYLNIGETYVFLIEEKIVGYIVITEEIHEDIKLTTIDKPQNLDFKDFIYIRQLAISKDIQGRGYGQLMFLLFLEKFIKYNIYSHVSIRNIPSMRLHLACGFKKVGTFKGIYTKDYESNLLHLKNE